MYRICNWKEYQHYGDKKYVPWIKLHYRILTSESWMMLDDSHKCLMLTCMLHASENKNGHNGEVTKSINYLTKLGNIKGSVSFKPLIDYGFLEPIDELKFSLDNSRQDLKNSLESYSISISESKKGGVGGATPKPKFPDEFVEFWNHFPKQRAGSKDRAFLEWKKCIERGDVDEAGLIESSMRYAASEEVARGFAKGCAAWLKDDRWRNDYNYKIKSEKTGYFNSVLQATARAAQIVGE